MHSSIGWLARATICAWIVAVSTCAESADSSVADRLAQGERPALTVVIAIDQFRADYLPRFADLFLAPTQADGAVGGFRYLMANGTWFVNARYAHFPTFTCVGHAAMMTGANPYASGIVSNRWWDRAKRADVYCVDDDRYRVVGAAAGSKAKPMGPQQLRSTTVGDELKLATGGRAKVVTLALKDRAAILLGGHTQDVSIWFDDGDGRWISSTAYARDGQLPGWVQTLNAEAIPEHSLGTSWLPSVPEAAFARTLAPKLTPQQTRGLGVGFPHKLGSEKTPANLLSFTLTPAANAFVLETARRAVSAERLGQRGVPDLLAINLSTNDYAGHIFGPYSPEVLDLTVQTDRELAGFFAFLNKTVPGGLSNVLLVLTSDHGIAPIPEDAQAFNIPAGRLDAKDLQTAVDQALTQAFGEGPWIGAGADGKPVGTFVDPNLYLSESAIAAALANGRATAREQIEAVAARALTALPGIYAAYTRSQIEQGRLPATDLAQRVAVGFHPKLSGDVVVVTEQGFYAGSGGVNASHGSPWAYDGNVPILIAGPGVRQGIWAGPVTPADIAPTLSLLLGIAAPAGSDGKVLAPALR